MRIHSRHEKHKINKFSTIYEVLKKERINLNMENNTSKGTLAVILSKLKQFYESKVRDEQYSTDSEIAADILSKGEILGDFADKTVVDLGAGTGILGIGALLKGANKVIFVEKDNCALKITKENYENIKSEHLIGDAIFENKDIAEFSHNADTVIMNPPFGTKKEHADKEFLKKAFETAKIVYSFHKTTTRKFVEAFAKDSNFKITHSWDFEFPLKQTMKFHEKKIKKIAVSAFRFQQV